MHQNEVVWDHPNSGGSTGAVFNGLRLSAVKEFLLQMRRCSWVEFKDVPLRPAPSAGREQAIARIKELGGKVFFDEGNPQARDRPRSS